MDYQQIKKQTQDNLTVLFEKYGVFFAFSSEQFEEGMKKYPVNEGEKYSSLGMGGYLPAKNKAGFRAEYDKLYEDERKALKAAKHEAENAIRYELANYECYYSNDISPVVDIFKGIYTRAQIVKVYHKNRAEYLEIHG